MEVPYVHNKPLDRVVIACTGAGDGSSNIEASITRAWVAACTGVRDGSGDVGTQGETDNELQPARVRRWKLKSSPRTPHFNLLQLARGGGDGSVEWLITEWQKEQEAR